MGTFVAGGGKAKPTVNYRAKLQTLGGRLPSDGLGVESIEGLELGETEVIEYSELNDEDGDMQLPGRTKYKKRLKIVRARDANDSLQRWRQAIVAKVGETGVPGEELFDTLVVSKLSEDGVTVVEQWFVDGAWLPVWNLEPLTRKGNSDVHREVAEFAYQKMRCVKNAVPASVSTLPQGF